jgi:CHAT domain-containing protein
MHRRTIDTVVRVLVLACCLGLPVAMAGLRDLRGDEPKEDLTTEQREQLVRMAKTLSQQAMRLYHQARFVDAVSAQKQAVELNQQLYPKEKYPQGHPDLADSLHKLGFLLLMQEEYGQARPYCERALEMRQQLYPKEKYPQGELGLAASFSSLGALLEMQGEYGQARPYYERALAMYQQLYPKENYPHGHHELAGSLYSLGALLEAQGDHARALPPCEQALAMYQQVVELMANTAAETEALNFLARLPLTRDGFLTASAHIDTIPAEQVYAPLWRGKAAIARVLASRRQQLHSDDPKVRALADDLLSTRRQLARLLLAPAGGPKQRQRLDDLAAHKEDLERQLVRLDRELFGLAPRPLTKPAELLDALPTGAVFVDFLRYIRIEYDPKQPGKKGERRIPQYVAFLLRKNQRIQRIELGEAKAIDDAIAAWRQALLDGKTVAVADTPHHLVWEPIARVLRADARTIYLCPDDQLTRLPWATLPGSKPGRVLLEDYQLAVVPHGAFLLEQLQRPPSKEPPAPGHLLAVGGVRYDEAAPTDKPGEVVLKREPAQDNDKRIHWPDLPGSSRELSQLLNLAGKRTVTRLSSTDASTDRVVAELPQAQVAHFATHGFFADPKFRSALRMDEKTFDYRGIGPREQAGARNPLVLSGLVLAGANVPITDPLKDDRGILTAEAIAGLPLDKLDLAVSACETGLGDVAGGEGVFGLQRAFHLAGTRNVVASLWRVNDEATVALMQLFYHYLWQVNLPPIEALRQAQLYLYRHPGKVKDAARGAPDFFKDLKPLPAETPTPPPTEGERGHPRLWAGFLLSGAGR